MTRRRCLPAILLGVLLTAAPAHGGAPTESTAVPVHSKKWTRQYDRYFRKYTKQYFGPGFDWHWFKAQAIAESTLNPNAHSRSGARGLMQIVPRTFGEIRKSNPHYQRIDEPRWNVAAGIYYMRYLYDRWQPLALKPPLENKLSFTFASYNAGFGGARRAMRKAKRRGRDERSWTHVAPLAPKETRRYVERIRALMGRI